MVGRRALKTGIAVAITLFLSTLMKVDYPLFGMIAAIVCIQPTVAKSITEGAHRLAGTLIGAAVGLVLYYLKLKNPIIAGAAVVLTIQICDKLGLKDSVVIGSIVALAVYFAPDNGMVYAFSRFFHTMVGVLVATGINYVVLRPEEDVEIRV